MNNLQTIHSRLENDVKIRDLNSNSFVHFPHTGIAIKWDTPHKSYKQIRVGIGGKAVARLNIARRIDGGLYIARYNPNTMRWQRTTDPVPEFQEGVYYLVASIVADYAQRPDFLSLGETKYEMVDTPRGRFRDKIGSEVLLTGEWSK